MTPLILVDSFSTLEMGMFAKNRVPYVKILTRCKGFKSEKKNPLTFNFNLNLVQTKLRTIYMFMLNIKRLLSNIGLLRYLQNNFINIWQSKQTICILRARIHNMRTLFFKLVPLEIVKNLGKSTKISFLLDGSAEQISLTYQLDRLVLYF